MAGRGKLRNLKLKEFIKGLSVKQIVLSLITVISFLFFAILTIWSDGKVKGLTDQQAAARWDEDGGSAQVSCFMAEHVEIDEFKIMSFEKQLEQSLMEVLPAEDKILQNGRRLFIDAYASLGKITVKSEKSQLEDVNAVGIGGDFFQFHPLQLLSGRYFSGSDLMKDAVVLDQDAAWQLFGSSDIEGKTVMIGEVPHYVAGVIKRPEGKFAENAGLDKTIVFVSNETLESYGVSEGISVYEVTAPNPVKNFVYNCVKEKLGIQEGDMVVVENSSRYKAESLIPVILEFGSRSMQNAAVKFPYWENIGRGWEDVKALILLFQFVFLLVPAVIIAAFLWNKWKNRNFTWRDIVNLIVKAKDDLVQKAHGEKNKWE